jgi:hypothetical protein
MTAPLAEKAVAKKAAAKKAATAGRHRAENHAAKHALPDVPVQPDRPAEDSGKRAVPVAAAGNAAAGAASSLSKALPRNARRLLAAELFIGSALILGSPDARSSNSPYTDALKQEAYLLLAFLILALLSMGGPQTAQVAAAFGGLIVIILALKVTPKLKLSAEPSETLTDNADTSISPDTKEI